MTFYIDALTDDRKEVGLQVNTKKIWYMLMYRHQNAGQIHNLERANKAFENMAKNNNNKKSKLVTKLRTY
jgi:hypothetical protein